MNTRRRIRCLALLALTATALCFPGSANAAEASDAGLRSVVRETKPQGYAAAPNPNFPDGPMPSDSLTSTTNSRLPEGAVGYGVQWTKPGDTVSTIVVIGASTPSARAADDLVASFLSSPSSGAKRFDIDIEGARALDTSVNGKDITVIAFKRNGRAFMIMAGSPATRTDAILLAIALDEEARLIVPRDDLRTESATSLLDHLVGIMAGFLLIAALVTAVLTVGGRPKQIATQAAPAITAPVMPDAPPMVAVSSPPLAGYVEPPPAPPPAPGRWSIPTKE